MRFPCPFQAPHWNSHWYALCLHFLVFHGVVFPNTDADWNLMIDKLAWMRMIYSVECYTASICNLEDRRPWLSGIKCLHDNTWEYINGPKVVNYYFALPQFRKFLAKKFKVLQLVTITLSTNCSKNVLHIRAPSRYRKLSYFSEFCEESFDFSGIS